VFSTVAIGGEEAHEGQNVTINIRALVAMTCYLCYYPFIQDASGPQRRAQTYEK